MDEAARDAFIHANTALRPVPHVPEIALHVAHEAMDLWQKTEDELAEIGLPPPFWAFAWAGGQGLARYVLDNPEVVSGKRVLDFASGSGLVGVAAAKAGAAQVLCADIDGFAISAIALNARANGVVLTATSRDVIGAFSSEVGTGLREDPEGRASENASKQEERAAFRSELIENCSSEAGAWDVILAGDICYEQALAARVIAWLEAEQARGVVVLIGDPGRAYLPKTRLEALASYQVPVVGALEDNEIKKTSVWRLK